MLRRFFLIISLSTFSFSTFGFEIWVSPSGNDLSVGTKESPMQTVSMALRHAREMRRLSQVAADEAVVIKLMNGLYMQGETIMIRPEDSGTAQSPTIIEGAADGKSVISGGVRVAGWRRFNGTLAGLPESVKGKLWVAESPWVGNIPLDFRQLWVNGRKAVRSNQHDINNLERILNYDHATGQMTIPAPRGKNFQNARQMELVIHQRWAVAFLRVKDMKIAGDSAVLTFHNPEARLEAEHPWPPPIVNGERGSSAFYLNNAPQFLDTPGEWYRDAATGRVYYYPREGEDMTSAEVIAPNLETILTVEGMQDRRVRHVILKNLSFEHSSWMRPSQAGHVPLQGGMYLLDAYKLEVAGLPEKATLENQAWIARPEAAVTVSGAEDINFENCTFTHLASTGVDFEKTCRRVTVENCEFFDIAGTALMAGAFGEGGFETHVPFNPSNTDELCSFFNIKNNLITDIANEDWGAVGIAAGYVHDFNIENNEVHDVPYSGICVGWGWTSRVTCMKNNRIHANLVYDFAKQMYDTGGIYTLSAQPGSEITGNHIHSIGAAPYAFNERAFYIYFDEGSAFITVRGNRMPELRVDSNNPGPGNVWEDNGPDVEVTAGRTGR